MQSKNLSRENTLKEVCLILAEFFKPPTKDLYNEIESGLVDEEIKELSNQLNILFQVQLKGRYSSFEEMEKTYMRFFSGVIAPYAPPVESIYKVWTTDPTAKVAHANSKGYLLGDSALHIRYLFQIFNIQIPEEYQTTPDHLTLLLEFLALLLEQSEDKKMIYQFINDHFDWLDDYKTELKKIEDHSLYLDIISLLYQLINNEKQVIGNE